MIDNYLYVANQQGGNCIVIKQFHPHRLSKDNELSRVRLYGSVKWVDILKWKQEEL